MESRRKKMVLNISHPIKNPGSVIPHAAVAILHKFRKAPVIGRKGGSRVNPLVEYDPFPSKPAPRHA